MLLFGGLDYKLLMTGEDPLSILMPVLSSTNVHVIAKLANKVPCKVAVSLKTVLLWNTYLTYDYCIWWLGIATYIEYTYIKYVGWVHLAHTPNLLYSSVHPVQM